MTYQIQVKYPNTSTLPLWQDYGSTTTAADGTTTFVPFSTNSIGELQTELENVDAAFGYENIRAIAIPEFDVAITVTSETEETP